MRTFFSNPFAALLLIVRGGGLIWLLITPYAFRAPDVVEGRVRVTMWYITHIPQTNIHIRCYNRLPTIEKTVIFMPIF